MPRPPFTAKYRLWGDWLKNANPNSSYTKKIIKLHQIYPNKDLKFLRSLKISDVDFSSKPLSALTDNEFVERSKSLKVLQIMRREGTSLSKSIEIAKNYGFNISEQSVRKHLGSTIYKAGNVWKVRKTDKIQTRMSIYSNGAEETITVTNSKDRNLIGRYFSDLRKVQKNELDENTFKKRYSRKVIVDAKGKKWKLETDIEAIANIQAIDETNLYRSIYDYPR